VLLDSLLGVVYDYFAKNKTSSYASKWNEWIVDDWVDNYIGKLEPFGLKIPKYFAQSADRVKWIPHTAAMVAAASWPLHYWRFPPLTDKDMEWFENQYPGWYALYGEFWKGYQTLSDPAHKMIPLQALPGRPPLCQVCAMPCVFPRLDCNEVRLGSYEGRTYGFCSAPCEEIFVGQPIRYTGYKQWDDEFHGWGLDEFIVRNNLLRADGKTLLAQPHVNAEKMWTLDDIKALNFEILDPLRGVEAPPVGSGLAPNGAASNGAASNGAASNGAAS
jgi:hypothetical protein